MDYTVWIGLQSPIEKLAAILYWVMKINLEWIAQFGFDCKE
jgi:hypothetical protein